MHWFKCATSKLKNIAVSQFIHAGRFQILNIYFQLKERALKKKAGCADLFNFIK